MMLKCPKCGSENSDYAFYCGKCASELPRAAPAQKTAPAKHVSSASLENPMAQLDPRVADAIKANYEAQIAAEREAASLALMKYRNDAQVSNAINIRRIALVLILAVVVTIGNTLVSIAISAFDIDRSGERTILTLWLVSAALVMIVGLFIIVHEKRLTMS